MGGRCSMHRKDGECILKMTVFWDVATCSLVEVYRVSEMRTASIIALVMEYVPLKRRSTSARLHGAISKKAVIFILSAVRT
jgi:hypothetical protein